MKPHALEANQAGPALLSAQERLNRSRQALQLQLNPHGHRDESFRDADGNFYSADPQGPTFSTEDGVWPMLRRAGITWWHFHPARRALRVVEPAVASFARSHPWAVIGGAAGAGVVLVVLRPWKLLSLSGLALAALRSSELSSVAMALLTTAKNKYSTDLPP